MGPQPTPSLSSQAYQAVTWKGQRLSEEHNFSVSATTTFSSPPQGNPESSSIATSGHQRDQEIRDRKKHKRFLFIFFTGGRVVRRGGELGTSERFITTKI